MQQNLTNKKEAITSILTAPLEFDEGVAFYNAGLMKHSVAKRQADQEGIYDGLFGAFERTWGALHSFNAMEDHKNDVILEMGCAEIPIYNAYKMQRTYPNYIGVDIRRDYLISSKFKNRKNVLALCADITKPLPIKPGTISAVVLSETVEHLSYEQNLLFFKEAFRLLKPGGKVLISSPMNTEDREFHNVEKEKNLGHVFFWAAEKFEEEMLKIGFNDVDKQWGYSISTKIRVAEIKKALPPAVGKFIEDISRMYGSRVARAVALSAPGVTNGGCRFTLTK